MLEWITDSFLSKAGEKLVEYGLDTLRDNINFNCTLETTETNLKSLSAKAYDIEKEIRNAELSGKKKRKREVEEWLEHVKNIESEFRTLESEVQTEGFINRFLGGDGAKKLNERVNELVEQSRHFGELLLDADKTKGDPLLTTRLVGEAFAENLERIWTLLRADNVSRIGIYGMGGVGKTTLAKHINNKIVEANRECVFWVTVSQEPSIRMLQDKIAHVVGLDLSDEYDEDKRAARLNRELSSLRKNFVLILDDVWKNISLEKVGDPLHVEGCRLIITTRSLQVCRQIGCQQVIALKTLDTDEAWNLFSKTLGQEITLSPQVEEIAKSMAKLCDGLPLGIITLAGSIKGETAIHVWRNALEELRKSVMEQDDMQDQVFKVLKYSFDRLNPKHQGNSKEGYTELQHCFLYCSLYPEDYEIEKKELVSKFILEGLVDKRKSRRGQLDQGHAILDKLVNVCLLEIYGNCVKLHDLVRAMALKITESKTLVISGHYTLKKIPSEEEWTMDVEKISLMHNGIKKIPIGMSPNCPKLTTLLLQTNPLKFIPDSFFSQMCELCVLDLSDTYIKELPDALSELESLKALLLGNCVRLVSVPYLGKLKALKELDLSNTAIKELPQGMDKLLNLRRLILPYQILVRVQEIKRLIQLEEFRGRVKDVSDYNRLIRSRRFQGKTTFYIMVGIFRGADGPSGHSQNNEIFVCQSDLKKDESSILAPGVQHLTINKCKGLSNCLLDDVQHLTLNKCKGLSICLLDDFPRLNNPESLKTLEISMCKDIKWVLTNPTVEELESKSHWHPLETLEQIVLSKLQDFMGLVRKRVITQAACVFSSLTHLTVTRCNKMKKLGLTGLEFPNLEEICVEECEAIKEIIQVADAENLVISLPKLKKLRLTQLPRLESICKAKMNCSSIRSIQLQGCHALKKLPLFFPTYTNSLDGLPYYDCPPTLMGIDIGVDEEGWWESLEWEHRSHKDLLYPLVRV